MTPIEPRDHADGWRVVIFAKDQPEYLPLPACVSPEGIVETEWAPTTEDLVHLLSDGRIRLRIHTGNRTQEDWSARPFAPVQIDVVEPAGTMHES